MAISKNQKNGLDYLGENIKYRTLVGTIYKYKEKSSNF